ncbi:DNA-binding protein [Clostridium chrysemydis]|uniref:DNA-binding protein n=1 Tax=Clostridium chrysemydis TaxID=2665504 RepID=UPI001883E5A1|nr:DNA-binding protein [Clostridium chrysemydis]
MGAIKDSKTRYPLTLEKEFKAELEQLAKKKGLTLNSLITLVMREYADKKKD